MHKMNGFNDLKSDLNTSETESSQTMNKRMKLNLVSTQNGIKPTNFYNSKKKMDKNEFVSTSSLLNTCNIDKKYEKISKIPKLNISPSNCSIGSDESSTNCSSKTSVQSFFSISTANNHVSSTSTTKNKNLNGNHHTNGHHSKKSKLISPSSPTISVNSFSNNSCCSNSNAPTTSCASSIFLNGSGSGSCSSSGSFSSCSSNCSCMNSSPDDETPTQLRKKTFSNRNNKDINGSPSSSSPMSNSSSFSSSIGNSSWTSYTLSPSSTINSPSRGSTVIASAAAAAAAATASASASSSASKTLTKYLRCLWYNCRFESILNIDSKGVTIETANGNDELIEHIKLKHISTQENCRKFRCFWKGCKFYDQPSKSFTWLQRHVLDHIEQKPFSCIIDGCKRKFRTEVSLNCYYLIESNQLNFYFVFYFKGRSCQSRSNAHRLKHK
jgi:hypothetical protein